MSDELDKPRHSQVSAPLEGRWSREAAAVRSPVGSFMFGLRARANVRALNIAGQHARAVGALMDIAVQTMDKMQRAQDRAREFAAREAHHAELLANHSEQLLDELAEARHHRAIAAKRRRREEIDADMDILTARQAQRAKKKFERLKHEIGEERFKTEAARRKVGAAEAELAMRDAGQRTGQATPLAPDAGVSKAAVISETLQEVRGQLQAMRADGEDSDERRALIEEESALERLLAKLLWALIVEPLRARAAKLLADTRRERELRFPNHRCAAAASALSPRAAPTPCAVSVGKTVVLGRDDRRMPLALDEESRLRHMQVLGTTGSGKSNLFFQIARQDIENGRGVLFLDPHGSHPGSGYRQLIAWLTESGLGAKRVVHIIDPNAGTHCTGFNPLQVPPDHHPSVVAEAALECFQRLWGDEDPDTKPTIQRLLPAVLGALAERGLTLAEATSVLDPDDRDGLRAYLAAVSTDDYAREELQWLQDIGLERGGRHDLRVEVTGPRNRVAKLVRLPSMRTMVGQTQRVIDLRAAMDDGHIILANLSGGGLVYERAADLLGRLLVRFLVFHAKRRRRPERFFGVYADECQRYLTGDLPVALAELRKQGVALALGCQWQSQLAVAGDEVLSAVRNATNIKIAFQLKDHMEAADLAEMLIPLNLEEPIAALNKETVVGYRTGRMRSGGITQSNGTSSGLAHSVTDSTSVTRSQAQTIGSADTVSHSHTRSQSRTIGESESETVSSGSSETIGCSGSQTVSAGGSHGTSAGGSAGVTRTSNYDGPFALGLPDSNSVSSDSSLSDSTSSSSSWSEAEESGWSEASTSSESTSQSHSTSWSETEGEAETDGTAHTESRSTSEGTAQSQGRSTGTTTSSGKNSGTAHTDGWSEALVPIMAIRPGGVHSKENQAYKAAQLLRSLSPGRCVINYVGPNGLETAMLRIPFRPAAPLNEPTFAKMRAALFATSPSALPCAQAEAQLRERRQALQADIDRVVLSAPTDPEEFRIAAPKAARAAKRAATKPPQRS